MEQKKQEPKNLGSTPLKPKREKKFNTEEEKKEYHRKATEKHKRNHIDKGLVQLASFVKPHTNVWLLLTKKASGGRTMGEIVDALVESVVTGRPFSIEPKKWPKYIQAALEQQAYVDGIRALNKDDPALILKINELKSQLGEMRIIRKKREKKVVEAPQVKKVVQEEKIEDGKKVFDRENPMLWKEEEW